MVYRYRITSRGIIWKTRFSLWKRSDVCDGDDDDNNGKDTLYRWVFHHHWLSFSSLLLLLLLNILNFGGCSCSRVKFLYIFSDSISCFESRFPIKDPSCITHSHSTMKPYEHWAYAESNSSIKMIECFWACFIAICWCHSCCFCCAACCCLLWVFDYCVLSTYSASKVFQARLSPSIWVHIVLSLKRKFTKYRIAHSRLSSRVGIEPHTQICTVKIWPRHLNLPETLEWQISWYVVMACHFSISTRAHTNHIFVLRCSAHEHE